MNCLLDIIKRCDTFPQPDLVDPTSSTSSYAKAISELFRFYLPHDPNSHGFMHPEIVRWMPWTPSFLVEESSKSVQLLPPSSISPSNLPALSSHCNTVLTELSELTRTKNRFHLPTPKDESFPIPGTHIPSVAIERYIAPLFGIICPGAHMTVYVRDPSTSAFRIWIGKRSATKTSFPSMYDNCVAGGIASTETPFECIIREAEEEAGLRAERVRREVKSAGTVTWMEIAGKESGGEVGLVVPGVVHVFDLEVPVDEVLKVEDGEGDGFELLDEAEIRRRMLGGLFKPNCAVVMVDFWVRHGVITAENEQDYVEIVERLHRKLPFRSTPPVA